MVTFKRIVKQCLPYGIVRATQIDRHKKTHINRALRSLNGHTYVEIGVASGKCFRQIVASRKIAVDPAPKNFSLERASSESLFKMTSDNFFGEHAEQLFRLQRVDVALVDGLHEFEQALQDVLNLEKYMSPRGVIFIHDCNPSRREHTEGSGRAWTGDVWKVAYYLTTYRRDLTFFTLDCDWGVGVLTGFGASSGSELPSSEILERCKLLDYERLDRNRKQILRLRPAWYSRVFFRFIHRRVRGQSG